MFSFVGRRGVFTSWKAGKTKDDSEKKSSNNIYCQNIRCSLSFGHNDV